MFFQRITCPVLLLMAAALVLILAGCGGHKQARVNVPPAPPITATQTQPETKPQAPPEKPQTTEAAQESQKEEEKQEEEEPTVPADAKPILVETGLASWYGAPYHNRRGSNGEVYNMHAFTAAHRTLPLGSIVRVTNVKTDHSVLVRITDRGPFVKGRILDLSLAAAKKIEVWAPGTAMVHMEVLQTPAPLDQGGRWAVQIGGIQEQSVADDLAGHLTRRYHSAKVLCFSSPVGDWWVRVRVKDDDRKRAEEVAHDTTTPEGAIFLVRLD